MKLIVGLGNPGEKYENTRHNIGYKVIDAFSHKYNVELNKEKFNGIFCKVDNFILAKPLTYMNNSGEFVSKLMNFFKIKLEDLLVVYDDIDMETGKLRYREKGSSGGQNGIGNIIELLGTDEVKRLKIGIGRPKNSATDWVLGRFTELQIQTIDKKKDEIIEFIDSFIRGV